MFFIVLINVIATILSLGYFFIHLIRKKLFCEKVDNYNLKLIISFSLTGLFWILSYSLNIVYEKMDHPIIEKGVEQYPGTLGDLIGGVLNPVLALFGILAGALAFYAQYQANKQIQDQFTIQQFESQFYEMLHLHRENLNEMIIEGYKYDFVDITSKKIIEKSKKSKITSGKKIFVTMLKEFEAIHLICKKLFFNYYKSNSKKLLKIQGHNGKQLIFEHAYFVFFNGVSLYEKNIEKFVTNDSTKLLNEEILKRYAKELRRIREEHEDKGIKEHKAYTLIRGLKSAQLKNQTLWVSFNYRPFAGHQSILAHYYRHLFQIVKFVTKQDETLINYESKRDYLRVLRSMLSNHEQILLYYNWIGGFGNNWENKDHNKRKNKEGNYFFSDYRMIHNIPPQMVIEDFNLIETFDENYQHFLFEKNRKKTDTLFELLNIVSLIKE